MTASPHATDAADSNGAVVFVCRNAGRRAVVERLVQPVRTHAAAMDALLAVARETPRAVLLNLEDLAGAEQDVLAALRRCRPNVPVCFLVAPEDEPRGRRLVAAGAADYFVLPDDVRRLPALLHPEPEAVDPGSTLTVEDRRASRLFRAVCDLAELAASQPQPLLRDGAMLILRALGAKQGRVFSCETGAPGPEPVAVFGETDPDGAAGLETERAAAERAVRTGEVLLLAAGAAGAPPDGLLCVPVRHGDTTFGILCLSGRSDAARLDTSDRDAAASLADVLAHLYRSALLRSEYARQALRDAKTGLLRTDPFLVCLETQISRAEDLHTEVGLLLLGPGPGARPQADDVMERLGVGIQAALAAGWEAGRLDTGLYAVVLPRLSAEASAGETEGDLFGDALASLAEVGRRTGAGAALRTALAVFPRDGTTAGALVAAAKDRLAELT